MFIKYLWVKTVDRQKILSFQGLRGFAITLIIISHCAFKMNQYGHIMFMYAGALGVELFIILSGFLAAYNYSSGRKISLFRKAKKVYPLHICTFFISVPLCLDLFRGGEWYKGFIKALLNIFSVNIWVPVKDYYYVFNTVSWYLGLVFFFVIITPCLMAFINKLDKKQVIILLICIIVLEGLWSVIFRNSSWGQWLVYICPPIRCLDFFVGMLVWKLCNEERKMKKETVSFLLLLELIVISWALYCSCFSNSIFFVVVWIIPSVVLLAILKTGNHCKIVKILFENRIIVFVGNISFELFLIHQLVIRYLVAIWHRIGLKGIYIKYTVAILISVILAVAWKRIWKKIQLRFSAECV